MNHAADLAFGILALILSSFSAFYEPQKMSVVYLEQMEKWKEIGDKFEAIFYSNNFDDVDFERRISDYEKLTKEIHKLKILQAAKNANCVADILFWIIECCTTPREKWLQESV